ncbi:MAG: alpha-hydroxy acid oxidase, partial [Endozoicomonas sp.]|uniref:alpha-hydroxy acid oxidase n=1 Tax=Endozoicomonas sp. TaxID=1892382 RepID=UPI003D9BD92E
GALPVKLMFFRIRENSLTASQENPAKLYDERCSTCALKFLYIDLAWLCKETQLPVLGKGIMTAADALSAMNHGAAGIIISNHGGRNLDSGLSTIQVLPEIRSAVPEATILLDGGIRRGTDILKALALGANAVLIGRPYLYGLAASGSKGVEEVIKLLGKKLETAMILTGCPNTASISRDIIY